MGHVFGGSLARLLRGERPAGRAELLAKKGASGRMQRPPELVPIPEYLLGTSLVPPEGFGKFAKIQRKFRQKFNVANFGNFWQNYLN